MLDSHIPGGGVLNLLAYTGLVLPRFRNCQGRSELSHPQFASPRPASACRLFKPIALLPWRAEQQHLRELCRQNLRLVEPDDRGDLAHSRMGTGGSRASTCRRVSLGAMIGRCGVANSRRALVSAIGTVFLTSLLGCPAGLRWEETDRFIAGLKCGMTAAEIERYAQTFKGTEVYEPGSSDLPTLVVKHGTTKIGCWLTNGSLDGVDVSWISQPMKLMEEPRRSLCAGDAR